MADNRLGPRVATLIAATMRGGTSQCLRGFGFRVSSWSQRRHDRQEKVEPYCEGSPPPFDLAEEAQRPSPSSDSMQFNSSGSSLEGLLVSEGRKINDVHPSGNVFCSSKDSTAGAKVGSVGETPFLKPILTGDLETKAGEDGKKSNLQFESLPESKATAKDAAAFEEEIGRPQTAGTASG